MTIPDEPTPTHGTQPNAQQQQQQQQQQPAAPQSPGAQQQPAAAELGNPQQNSPYPPPGNPQQGNPVQANPVQANPAQGNPAQGTPYPPNAQPQYHQPQQPQPQQPQQPQQPYNPYAQPQPQQPQPPQQPNPAYPPYGQVPPPGSPYPYPATGVAPDEKRELAPDRVRVLIPIVWAAAALSILSLIITMATGGTSLPGLSPRQADGVQAITVLGGVFGLIVQLGLYTLVLILLTRRRPVARILATIFASFALLGNFAGFIIGLAGGGNIGALCALLICAVCIAFLFVAWRPLRSPQGPGVNGV